MTAPMAKSMMSTPLSTAAKPMRQLLGWYLLFGALHEASHVVVAIASAATTTDYDGGYAPSEGSGLDASAAWNGIVEANGGSICHLLFHFIIQRQVNVPAFLSEGGMRESRHAGWIISAMLFISLLLHVARTASKASSRCKTSCCDASSNMTFADSIVMTNPMVYSAAIVAMEAISTDLMGFRPLLPLVSEPDEFSAQAALPLFCGNFGVILLHHNWLAHNNGEAAMEVLERMVRVTMMRGAQSGGVVTYYPDENGKSNAQKAPSDLVGIRCRVVNKKRTNLSKLVRAKVDKDILGKSGRFPNSGFVPIMSGHTRFATTSISTLDGTHPHIWTPPTLRRVYDTSKAVAVYAKQGPVTNRRVENYITHNGDFDFYAVNGVSYDLDVVQTWLQKVTGAPMPSTVDSCAVAGMVDVLRTQGCFGLSARYALALGLANSTITDSPSFVFPDYAFFEQVGDIFETSLKEYVTNDDIMMNLDTTMGRNDLAQTLCVAVKENDAALSILLGFVEADSNHYQQTSLMETGKGDDFTTIATLTDFCRATVNAFFDNDLFFTTKSFLTNAKGSFGLVISSSLDARRQVCIAAQGQSMSIAFYPSKGLICFGSEQAAVKSGLNTELPGDRNLEASRRDVDLDSLRLDLDDLGGEIVLLDWSSRPDPNAQREINVPPNTPRSRMPTNALLSLPNRNLAAHEMMNGDVKLITFRLDKSVGQANTLVQLFHRMTSLSRNALIRPLKDDSDDPILEDINEIPAVCSKIQDEFKATKASTSLNRLAAYNLSSCLRRRLKAKLEGRSSDSIDILLTGCEVSLWLAEQFGSDLQKAFPKLKIQATSSNKLLGLFGQEIAIPAFGFPYAPQTQDLSDTIIIIVSQSGGTFAPLNCSNLLQGSTDNLFVVTSEWDTQIGKQLRGMDSSYGINIESALKHRIFTTEVGMRPAEPSSISVVATHQLLTNLLEYLSAVILSEERYRRITGATMTEQDLQILERCNQLNISALADIIGINEYGNSIKVEGEDGIDDILRSAGNLWAEHILENARAYILSFIYVFATVVSGYPIVSAIAFGAGLDASSDFIYLIRLIDAAIYFWLPQINVTLVRLFQGRNLLHRMVGRTVVIGDIPWVAQSAEAFLSKIFACSYSIAGLNVLSGNATDHLVHRHTHRVVRGALVICGRPDGRLSALSTAEASTCLAVNQASSIQSWGGTCESITIGHNPFKLPLTKAAVFLKRRRPLFLCERMLLESDVRSHSERSVSGSDDDMNSKTKRSSTSIMTDASNSTSKRKSSIFGKQFRPLRNGSSQSAADDGELNSSIHPSVMKNRSAVAFLGAYSNFEGQSNKRASQRSSASMPPGQQTPRRSSLVLGNSAGGTLRSMRQVFRFSSMHESSVMFENNQPAPDNHDLDVQFVIDRSIEKTKYSDRLQKLFNTLDSQGNGYLTEQDLLVLPRHMNIKISKQRLLGYFHEADTDGIGRITYNQMVDLLTKNNIGDTALVLPASNKDQNGVIQIEASVERYFGFNLRRLNSSKAQEEVDFSVAKSQHFAQELYETRIASMQRFVAMIVMFHQMGKRVQQFFAIISFGVWTYRMDRTHSIMRIATTASPVSGADVREQMKYIRLQKKLEKSINTISGAYLRYKTKKEAARIKSLERRAKLLDENAAFIHKVNERELRDSRHRRTSAEMQHRRASGTVGGISNLGSQQPTMMPK